MESNKILHILICGGRHFCDYNMLKSTVLSHINSRGIPYQNIEIISGHCPGADALGEQFAKEHNATLKIFPARWKEYGRSAGPIRNKEMVDYISAFENKVVIAFVSPNSKGTRNTIALARKASIDVIITEYLSEESQ